MKKKRVEERPITARPMGAQYWVETSGKHHMRKWNDKLEDVSDNTLEPGYGCYRQMPTCRD